LIFSPQSCCSCWDLFCFRNFLLLWHVPEKNNLQERKVYVGSWFQRSQSWPAGSIAMGLCRGASQQRGCSRDIVKQSCSPHSSWEAERNRIGPQTKILPRSTHHSNLLPPTRPTQLLMVPPPPSNDIKLWIYPCIEPYPLIRSLMIQSSLSDWIYQPGTKLQYISFLGDTSFSNHNRN
jgi:hypothetical protein